MKRDVPAYQRCSFFRIGQRNSREVIAARSEFSLASVRSMPRSMMTPDSRFRLAGTGAVGAPLAPDTLLLIRGDVQLADRALVPIAVRFRWSGKCSGYRQDLLTDNGFCFCGGAATVLRIPVRWSYSLPPFVDAGTAPVELIQTVTPWRLSVSGLRWQQGDVTSGS